LAHLEILPNGTHISGTIDGDGRPQPALDVPAQISASVELDARAEIFG
jgi:hypothetical protein